MEPADLVETLKGWVEVTEDLAALVPGASPAELVEYVRGVIASPVGATVLVSALKGLPPVEVVPAPAAVPAVKKAYGARR